MEDTQTPKKAFMIPAPAGQKTTSLCLGGNGGERRRKAEQMLIHVIKTLQECVREHLWAASLLQIPAA